MIKALILLWVTTNSHPLSISLGTPELIEGEQERAHKGTTLHSPPTFSSSLFPFHPPRSNTFPDASTGPSQQENFAPRNVLLDTRPSCFQHNQQKEMRISSHFTAPPPPSLLMLTCVCTSHMSSKITFPLPTPHLSGFTTTNTRYSLSS